MALRAQLSRSSNGVGFPAGPIPRVAISARGGALLALVGGAMLVAVSTVGSAAALADLSPLTLAAARFGVASVALTLLCLKAGTRPRFGKTPALLGLSGVTLAFACQNIGLTRTSAMDATLIIEGGIPIATALLGTCVLRERMTAGRLVGLALALVGVAVVILQGGGDRGPISLLGVGMTLLAGIWFAVYTVAGRRAFAGAFSLPVLAGSVIIGTLGLLPGAAIEAATVGPGRLTLPAVAWVLFLGVGGSALAHILWGHGLAHLEAVEVGIIGTVMPVAGVGLAALILGEPMSLLQLGGAVSVVAGLGVATLPLPQRLRLRSTWVARTAPAVQGGSVVPGIG